ASCLCWCRSCISPCTLPRFGTGMEWNGLQMSWLHNFHLWYVVLCWCWLRWVFLCVSTCFSPLRSTISLFLPNSAVFSQRSCCLTVYGRLLRFYWWSTLGLVWPLALPQRCSTYPSGRGPW